MIKIFGFAILFSIGGILAEKALYAKIPSLSEPSSCFPSLPRSFGIFVAVITAFNFWTVTYGMTVGLARKKYKEMAEKNGEKDTEMGTIFRISTWMGIRSLPVPSIAYRGVISR